jgi:hypothetical protein
VGACSNDCAAKGANMNEHGASVPGDSCRVYAIGTNALLCA